MTDEKEQKQSLDRPELARPKGISPIWILPLIALVIAGWLVYKSVIDAGIGVVITFKTAQGIEKGKTRVLVSRHARRCGQ